MLRLLQLAGLNAVTARAADERRLNEMYLLRNKYIAQ
jgi:hypothetical protein